jgi:hypothetical protein
MSRLASVLPALHLLIALAALSTAAAACGPSISDDEGTGASVPEAGSIISSDRTYAIADFEAAGFKKSKTYDVSGLPKAVSAYYGFWGPDPYSREDYEIRFYASHADAVDPGQPQVLERVGKDAKLTEETAAWTVGVRDARECHGVQGQAQHAASCTEAKYYDYMIVGNMVLLCPGDATDVARKNCEALLAAMK